MSEGSETEFLESGGTRVEFDAEVGGYSVYSGDRAVFSGVSGRVLVRRGKGLEALGPTDAWKLVGRDASRMVFEGAGHWGRLLYRFSFDGTALIVELGFSWEDGEPEPVESIAPLLVPPGGIWPGAGNEAFRFYQNGFQCWSPSGTLKRNRSGDYLYPLFFPRMLKPMLANTATPITAERGSFGSEWFAGLADLESGGSVVVGFTGVTRALSQVTADLAGNRERAEIRAEAQFEGKVPDKGAEFWCEPLAVIPGDLSDENLRRYAELAAARQGVKEVRRAPPGWCSWYQYFTGVTRGSVEENLELASGKYADLGLKLVQVDDGYQPYVGDWLETNEDFPGDMKELADEISAKGRMPGIWLAPFTAARKSRLFKEHRDWLLRRPRGKRPVLAGINPMWKGRFYGLDLTNPDVLDWLRDLFETIAGNGYSFIKLDFLACGLLEGKQRDPTVTRAEAFRRALEVIRDAVGDDVYLLAAGGPMMLGVGVLDAQRIGGDVAPFWRTFYQPLLRDRSTPGVRNSLISVFTRSFMSGRLFDGDPDCLMVRSSDTKLTDDERRTLASAVGVLGGAFIVSDDMSLWGEEEADMLLRLLPHVSARPCCPDVWKREIPRYMVSRLADPSGGYYLVWVVNWKKNEQATKILLEDLGIEPGRYHACEFWTGSYLGEVESSMKLDGLPPHGSAVIRLTPGGDEPRVVGSNIHITQGAAELRGFERSPEGVRLSLSANGKLDALLFVSVPGGFELKKDAGDADIIIRRETDRVFRLRLVVDRTRDIDLALVAT